VTEPASDLTATTVLPETQPGVGIARVDTTSLTRMTHELSSEQGARLADLFATEAGDDAATFRVVYALDREQRYVVLESVVSGQRSPALSQLDPAAFVEECEIYEQFGIRPADGRSMNRVLTAPGTNRRLGWRGQGRDGRPDRAHAPHLVEGEAIEFPFGPVRAVGWESLYTGLVTTGEEVLDLYLFYWHKHRGIERRLVGRTPERALFFVERADGLNAIGNGLAFCHALEAAAGSDPPAPAAHARSIALELERIYNHTAAIAAVCQATGLSVGQAGVEIVLEDLLRLNAAAFGHRYLFGVLAPGGVRRAPDRDAIRGRLERHCDELQRVAHALLHTNSHVDRLEATGVLELDVPRRLGLVGPIARACGAELDSRRDHPFAPYDQLVPAVAAAQQGDVLSRMQVMLAEVAESERLIFEQLDESGVAATPVTPRSAEGLGWAESPRGESLIWLALDDDGDIARLRLRPASVRNWRAFDDAARSQNVFTDIPIIEASFWLTVAGGAR